MSEVKVNVNPLTPGVIVRTGEAGPVLPIRKALSVTGNIDTPLCYLKNPPLLFSIETNDERHVYSAFEMSKLIVDRDNLKMSLEVDSGMPWEQKYIGVIQVSAIFKEFGINSGKSRTTFELADFIKMNRSYFETKDTAMALVSTLRNFKAKVDKELENSDDNRGNKRLFVNQIVESNIPETFTLLMPIFKGGPVEPIEVEININASDFSCTLISPGANDFINENANEIIDEQITDIEQLWPTLKIFEV